MLEVTSASTRHNDERRKRDVYAALGVREYFLYDPRAEWLAPPLQGWSKWGHDFRPDYRYVGRFIREKAGDEPTPPVLCLTAATAKPDVVVDVTSHFRDELGIELTVFDGGVQRTNLEFVVVPTTGGGAEVPVAHFIEWLVEWGRDARRRQRGLLLSTAHRAYSGSLPPGAMTQSAVGSIDRDPGRWDAYVVPFSLVAGHRR